MSKATMPKGMTTKEEMFDALSAAVTGRMMSEGMADAISEALISSAPDANTDTHQQFGPNTDTYSSVKERGKMTGYLAVMMSWVPLDHQKEEIYEAIRSLILIPPAPPAPTDEERRELLGFLDANIPIEPDEEHGELTERGRLLRNKIRALLDAPPADEDGG